MSCWGHLEGRCPIECQRACSLDLSTAENSSTTTSPQTRVEDARRRSMQRIELEGTAVRSTVALALSVSHCLRRGGERR